MVRGQGAAPARGADLEWVWHLSKASVEITGGCLYSEMGDVTLIGFRWAGDVLHLITKQTKAEMCQAALPCQQRLLQSRAGLSGEPLTGEPASLCCCSTQSR